MKTITRYYNTLAGAEKFQNKLYNKYKIVRLIRFPSFSEEGNYTWEVSE